MSPLCCMHYSGICIIYGVCITNIKMSLDSYIITMDPEQLLAEIQLLREENALLKNENEKYKKQIDMYADKRKNYYEKKQRICQGKGKRRIEKLAEENPDKLKEYRRNAYLDIIYYY